MNEVLYHQAKGGDIRTWRIWADGADIVTEHGQLGGQLQQSRKTCVGKNIGKANETSPNDQAHKEAEAEFKLKLRKKYHATIDEAKQVQIKPMLAHKWEKYADKITFPVDVQPKLDGFRCMAFWKDGKVFLQSRGMKPINLPHIADQVRPLLCMHANNIALDGELYIHGMEFNKLSSLIRRHQPGSEAIEFHVYDAVNLTIDLVWPMRRGWLDSQKGQFGSHIKPVRTHTVASPDDVAALLIDFEQRDYEGAIIRGHQGQYKFGYRSRDLLKLKTFDDEEFEIVGAETGRGKFEGACIWVCKTADGQLFRATPEGDFVLRKQLFKNKDHYIGRMLTVKFFRKSKDGIPRFPIALRIRPPEDLGA